MQMSYFYMAPKSKNVAAAPKTSPTKTDIKGKKKRIEERIKQAKSQLLSRTLFALVLRDLKFA